MSDSKDLPMDQTALARQALRQAAGLRTRTETLHTFVASIADEMDALHALGKSNADIAAIIRASTTLEMTAEDLSANYEIPHHPVSPHD